MELGSGFHPDLTGVENIYLNASLLGFTRARTNELFDSIVEFSGIEEFINEPLRTYSSGMAMRLAFSVALEPGADHPDHRRSAGRGRPGVSRTSASRRFSSSGTRAGPCYAFRTPRRFCCKLCDRAIWLDHGQLMMDGKASDVLQVYTGHAVSG